MHNHDISQDNRSIFSEQLTKELQNLVDNTNVERLSRRLRDIVLDYTRTQIDVLPLEFDTTLDELYNLFHFMDVLSDTQKQVP